MPARRFPPLAVTRDDQGVVSRMARVARPEVLRRAWSFPCSTPFGVPQGVPPGPLGSRHRLTLLQALKKIAHATRLKSRSQGREPRNLAWRLMDQETPHLVTANGAGQALQR